MSIKSQFGKAEAKAEQGKRGETYPLDEERAQELLLQQSQAGKKKRPLIAKEKKAFDSADYFMKGEDGEGPEGGDQEGLEMIAEEQEQKTNPHKSKMSSNFSSKNQVQKEESEDDQEDQVEKERQRQKQQKENEERAMQKQREEEEKRVKDEQKKRAKREEEEREKSKKIKLQQQQEEEEKQRKDQQQQNQSSENDEEEKVMKRQQEAMMLKMKGNVTKKPLVAKQKKAFDSADYFMKDEHKDSDVAGTESDTIMEQTNNNKPGESKSKYGQQQAKEKKSSDSDSSKSSEKLVKIAPSQQQQTGGNSEGQSPRGSALKSRSGSESREIQNKETKRVSFSLPSEEQSATNGGKSSCNSACSAKSQASTASTFSTNAVVSISTEVEQPTATATRNNNVHSLKGSRFLTLPNTIQQESDSDMKQIEQESDLPDNNNSTKSTEPNTEELDRLYNEQLNQAQARLACGGKKKKPLIAKEKRKDFDSADYFLQQEKKKRESASSMFEFGNIEDSDDDDNYLNKNTKENGSSSSSKNKSKSKSNKNDYKKTASMPEFQDEDDTNQKKPSRLRESAFNRKEETTSSEEDSNTLEFQQNLDDDEDEDDSVNNKNSLSGFAGLSTAPNGVSLGSSFDEEEDFLPKITHSKISNSKFQVYKNHQSDEEEENQEELAEERGKQKKKEEEEKQDILEKQRQLDAIQNENNRITAAQSQKLMEEQSVGLAEANKYEQFAIPVSKHKRNLLNKEKKKEFDSADYFMKDK